MKLFVAPCPVGFISENYYNNCISDELLRFSIYQILEPCSTKSQICSMVGIDSLNRTTEILVRDLKIEMYFLKELLLESFYKEYPNMEYRNGEANISFGEAGIQYSFHIADLAEMLASKASFFPSGAMVGVKGRNFRLANTIIK
jgi:hypothetical protein